MDEPVVLLAVDGPVATITLNRPQARNAISSELLSASARRWRPSRPATRSAPPS